MPLPKRTYHPRRKLIQGYEARKHPLYMTWHHMLNRCFDEGHDAYVNYGGRGITVCDEWLKFENFALDMGMRPTPYHTLERADNNQGYNKLNCIWASRSEQCVNRRTFKINKSGHTGVLKLDNGTYLARFDYEKVRYDIGRFIKYEDAVTARESFVALFFKDRELAISKISNEVVSLSSTTKVRGVSLHKDGGYVCRTTIKGVRHYVGYFNTLEQAKNARELFIRNAVEIDETET